MKALSLWQPWASLVALGVKTIETRWWSTSYRGPLAIHAAKRKPVQVEKGFLLARHEHPIGEPPTHWSLLGADPETHGPWPVALGAVVATCNLVDVVPMVALDDDDPGGSQLLVGPVNLALLTGQPLCSRNVTDQRPYGDFAPGRHAWLLADIKPTTERCPRCWGTGDYEQINVITEEIIDEYLRMPCTRCDGEGVCDPIPAKGRQQLWEWAAA